MCPILRGRMPHKGFVKQGLLIWNLFANLFGKLGCIGIQFRWHEQLQKIDVIDSFVLGVAKQMLRPGVENRNHTVFIGGNDGNV